MFPLLILREEIVCLIILVFLWINGRFYKMGKDHGSFLRMSVYAIGHVVFDIITVLTVNHIDSVPAWVNLAAHIVFYLFAILFSQEFFCYIIALLYQKRTVILVRAWSAVLIIAYAACLPLLPIVYLTGNGTNYSYGMAAYIGYGLAMSLFVASAVVVAINYKKLAVHTRIALVPMLAILIIGECVQIVVPELLITGGAATAITVGFFFSLENPADVFKQKLMIDALTGVKSRHSYEVDIQAMEKHYAQDHNAKYGMVFCDINNLKAVNDNQGHLEGDTYIGTITQILMENMKSASDIYRMGGDEFLAVYKEQDESVILHEAELVRIECALRAKSLPYNMSVAIGYAISGPQYAKLSDVLRIADYMMYQNKAEMKKKVAFLSSDGRQLNISGLTDRIFDAFAATGDRNYLVLHNMTTNVSRWSKSAVDYFDLPGEFMFDGPSVWMGYIHPDDCADYWADLSEVLDGNRRIHDVEYRVRNGHGEYVMCTCRGTVLRGKNGDPDLFAATIVNHGIAENIDPVTGLHTEQVLIRYLDELTSAGTPGGFLSVSILTFSRINMLYGYHNGDEILRRFTTIAKELIQGKGRVFRLDGPKFLFCIPGAGATDLMLIFKELSRAVGQQIKLGDIAIPLRLGGGAFVMEPGFSGNSITVRNNLAHALDRSKQERRGKLVFYGDPLMDDMVGDYVLLARMHQDAVAERNGFYLKYQPILSMDAKRIIGAEALLRWRDEQSGEVNPGQFIPWLENDPCFYQLGRWILQKALEDSRKMLEIDPDFVVNVNVTVIQLEDERFDTMVLDVLQESDFPPHHLCLELTERCRELDFDFLKAQINFFHSCGIQVALDDVGSGFSSLGVLLKLPVDEIKLDKDFVIDIRNRQVNQVFVQAMIEAARRMGYHSCLEGVEDEETFQFLQQYGATSFQGYYHSKPLPPEELAEMLRAQAEQ